MRLTLAALALTLALALPAATAAQTAADRAAWRLDVATAHVALVEARACGLAAETVGRAMDYINGRLVTLAAARGIRPREAEPVVLKSAVDAAALPTPQPSRALCASVVPVVQAWAAGRDAE